MVDLKGKNKRHNRKCRNLRPLGFEENLVFINHRDQATILRESYVQQILIKSQSCSKYQMKGMA